MRYQLALVLFPLYFFSVAAAAQTDVEISKHKFKKGKEGFSEAWKHVVDGDRNYFLAGAWYAEAYAEYLKAADYNNSNPELLYKLGVSSLWSDNKEKSADYFLKALEIKPDVAPDILLLTGHALQFRGDFRGAADMLSRYLGNHGKKQGPYLPLAQRYIEECRSAEQLLTDTLSVDIVNTGTDINSSGDDYSEFVTGDDTYMIFASRRQTDKSNRYYANGKYDENILVSSIEDDKWGVPRPVEKDWLTPYCETPLYLTAGGDSAFIYAGYLNGGDILLSVKKKGVWRKPAECRADLNSKYHETSFTISPSGNEFWFVSDRKQDNKGGRDIYFVKKLDPRHWGKPENAGIINSPGDEESMRFSSSGDTLWFSSTGHNTMGGYDIFYSVRSSAGEWGTPVNAGYPLNTPWDELFYLPSFSDKGLFYFTSNRAGGYGGMDIYTGRYKKTGADDAVPDSLSLKQ